MRIDMKKDFARLYRPSAGRFTEVDVPPMRYLAFDGHARGQCKSGERAEHNRKLFHTVTIERTWSLATKDVSERPNILSIRI